MLNKITGIILSGGKSTRMGTDKGLIRFRDRSMIEYSLQMIAPYCNEIMISANNEAYKRFGYPVVQDEIIDIGPIGGILSCLKKSNNEKVFITACDLPEIEGNILQSLFSQSFENDLVFLKLSSGRIQPLPLILGSRTIDTIESLVGQKRYALNILISECNKNAGIVSKEIIIEKEPWNINTLTDLKHD